jgi:hypothetical protein
LWLFKGLKTLIKARSCGQIQIRRKEMSLQDKALIVSCVILVAAMFWILIISKPKISPRNPGEGHSPNIRKEVGAPTKVEMQEGWIPVITPAFRDSRSVQPNLGTGASESPPNPTVNQSSAQRDQLAEVLDKTVVVITDFVKGKKGGNDNGFIEIRSDYASPENRTLDSGTIMVKVHNSYQLEQDDLVDMVLRAAKDAGYRYKITPIDLTGEGRLHVVNQTWIEIRFFRDAAASEEVA